MKLVALFVNTILVHLDRENQRMNWHDPIQRGLKLDWLESNQQKSAAKKHYAVTWTFVLVIGRSGHSAETAVRNQEVSIADGRKTYKNPITKQQTYFRLVQYCIQFFLFFGTKSNTLRTTVKKTEEIMRACFYTTLFVSRSIIAHECGVRIHVQVAPCIAD